MFLDPFKGFNFESKHEVYTLGGNRTPANCLEGSYDTISPQVLLDAGFIFD
jgi:hypothetical protein